MPIYMDVHIAPGVTAKQVAEAHRQDLLHQAENGCHCMTYWIDEKRGNIFCLIEAPEKQAVTEMHRTAHGMVPNKIIEVSSGIVESFLGRIYDPEGAEITDDGLKVFSDSSFRTLLVTKTTDPVLLEHRLGSEKARSLLNEHNNIVRTKIAQYGGREVEHEGAGFIASFTAASKAVDCALAIQKQTSLAEELGLKIGINAGDPVEKSMNMFGDTIRFAFNLCSLADDCKIAVAAVVMELVTNDFFQKDKSSFLILSPGDETLLNQLIDTLEKNWQDTDFDSDRFCNEMAMSASQLYRKTVSLTSLSPNLLLKDFRLEKAKELLKKKRHSIAQITYNTGFTSASYFTKCFKSKYGLLPMAYIELLN